MDYQKYKRLFGLIGFPLSHSFSKKYFGEKFSRLGIADAFYELFPIPSIQDLPELIRAHDNLLGLNVTIPYKEQVLPFLDELDTAAAEIGAVNTIKIDQGKLIGYNTDVDGFAFALEKAIQTERLHIDRALVLGTGGAAKAVAYQLRKMDIAPSMVSRNPAKGQFAYQALTKEIIEQHQLIVNTTPLGMSPKINRAPDIPYAALNKQHLAYDLVYNPAETLFMKNAKRHGAKTINGQLMLEQQAEKAWQLWTEGENRMGRTIPEN